MSYILNRGHSCKNLKIASFLEYVPLSVDFTQRVNSSTLQNRPRVRHHAPASEMASPKIDRDDLVTLSPKHSFKGSEVVAGSIYRVLSVDKKGLVQLSNLRTGLQVGRVLESGTKKLQFSIPSRHLQIVSSVDPEAVQKQPPNPVDWYTYSQRDVLIWRESNVASQLRQHWKKARGKPMPGQCQLTGTPTANLQADHIISIDLANQAVHLLFGLDRSKWPDHLPTVLENVSTFLNDPSEFPENFTWLHPAVNNDVQNGAFQARMRQLQRTDGVPPHTYRGCFIPRLLDLGIEITDADSKPRSDRFTYFQAKQIANRALEMKQTASKRLLQWATDQDKRLSKKRQQEHFELTTKIAGKIAKLVSEWFCN